MKYFSNFPKIKYDFREDSVEMMDIFLRPEAKVTYDPKTFGEFTTFIEDGMSPDDVARKVYRNDDYFWFVLMYNDIIDIYKEWPTSYHYWIEEMSRIYNTETFYLPYVADVQVGDIVAKKSTSLIGNTEFDFTNSGVIRSIDSFFRSFDVLVLNGSINESNQFVIMRKNGRSYDNITTLEGNKDHTLIKKTSKLSSLGGFYTKTDNDQKISISGYSDITTKQSEVSQTTDDISSSNTVLQSYFEESLPTDVSFQTFIQEAEKEWIFKKNIKTIGIPDLSVLDNAYIKLVLGED
jgi:hypothetical protein